VDSDGAVEMITVGCTALRDLCDPDMRIWSLPQKISEPPSYLSYAVVAAIAAACAALLVFLHFRRAKSEAK
jgi:hypothetical protein